MDWPAKFIETVHELLSLIYSHEKSFTSVPEQAPRQMAAAGLMRCCALLRGVDLLEPTEERTFQDGVPRI